MDTINLNLEEINKLIDHSNNYVNKINGDYIIYPKTEKPVDYIREFKDLLSDFVTNVLLPESRDKFVREVYSKVNITLTIFKKQQKLADNDIIFVYKGGNILRLQYLNYKEKLPCYIYDQITTTYDKYFKASDADFSVYVNPKITNYLNIYSQVKNLLIVILNQIRCDFEADPLRYFDYFKYNKIVQKEIILNNLLTQLNDAAILKDSNLNSVYYGYKIIGLQLNDIYVGETLDHSKLKICEHSHNQSKTIPSDFYQNTFRSDFIIEDHSATETKFQPVVRAINCNHDSFFYISNNDAIVIKNLNGVVHFNLVRMKVNFRLYLKNNNNDDKLRVLNVGGELIDITMPHSDDFTLAHFVDNSVDYVEDYVIGKKEDRYGFKGYNINYIIDDLERMLFIDQVVPWDDAKYEKRLNRVMLFYFLFLLKNFDNKESSQNVKNMIRDLKIVASKEKINPDPTNNAQIRKLFFFIYDVINKSNTMTEQLDNFINKVIENLTNFSEYFDKILFIK
jgi:hypothetical protein